ncbi:hypothetical protein SAMN05421505_15118 [Sinosporangium album]|uniref:Uncharacterized protein n=1 Tax=Sinosporangium album TaxID=504805 RepID=A0A1G8KIU3_9ACTN|nr:hypothetical protein SAMN05421505_15118 [Sinosporangium album]
MTQPVKVRRPTGQEGRKIQRISLRQRRSGASGEVSGGDPGTRAAVTLALVSGLQMSVLAGRHTGEEAVALLTEHLDEVFR